MKILLLTERFDDTIPTGVISKRIADELHRLGHDVAVVSSELIGNKWEYGQHVICSGRHLIPARVLIFFSDLLQINLVSALWRLRLFIASKKLIKVFKPDIVYARSTPVSVCEVAAKLKQRYGVKVLMHFTDPVPPPIEWDNNKLRRKRLIRTMNRILPYADRISFGNQAMLDYQQKNQSYPFLYKSFISPDPVPQESLYYSPEIDSHSIITLVYLGSFHGSRNPYELFKAIEQFNHGKKKAELLVYDTNRTNIETPIFVRFVGRVNDVREVLLNGNILINLDGDDTEPVFISSKLKEYLCCGRPIISITPEGSPSRVITKDLITVVSTINHYDNILDAIMYFNNNIFSEKDYYERKDIIKSFTPKMVTESLVSEFYNIIK